MESFEQQNIYKPLYELLLIMIKSNCRLDLCQKQKEKKTLIIISWLGSRYLSVVLYIHIFYTFHSIFNFFHRGICVHCRSPQMFVN